MSSARAGAVIRNGRRIALAVACSTAAGTLQAQGIRLSGVTSAQWVELRPLQFDTAGVERSGSRINAAPFMQDLTLTAWGFGQGLSLHSNVRARTQLGDGLLTYPGSDDHFDVLDAYLQYDRANVRARLGRQWVTGGLGVYDFDGGDVLVRHRSMSLEAWGGRALAAGLFDTYVSSELAAAESRPPEQNGSVFGGRFRIGRGTLNSASVLYQRVMVADRSGLYSERAAFDGSTRQFGAQVDLSLAYDFAADQWNEARLRIGTSGIGTWGVSGEVRRSLPFFELWTIWGAAGGVRRGPGNGVVASGDEPLLRVSARRVPQVCGRRRGPEPPLERLARRRRRQLARHGGVHRIGIVRHRHRLWRVALGWTRAAALATV